MVGREGWIGRWPIGIARFLSRLRPIEADLPAKHKLLGYVLMPRNHAAVFTLIRGRRLRLLLAFIPAPTSLSPMSHWCFSSIFTAEASELPMLQSLTVRAASLIAQDWNALVPDDQETYTLEAGVLFLGVVKTDIQTGGSWRTERQPMFFFGRRAPGSGGPRFTKSFVFAPHEKDIAATFFRVFKESITKMR